MVSVTLSSSDWQAISGLIQYGTHMTVQREYEFVRPEYDEDAGIFTDYGLNETARTWANVYMTSLLQRVILDIDYRTAQQDLPPETTEFDVEGMLLDMAIPALVHLLVCCLDQEHQKNIWLSKIRGDYESDGHYGRQSRQEYIDSELQRHMVDRKRIKYIIDAISEPYSAVKKESKTLKTRLAEDVEAGNISVVDGRIAFKKG